MSVPRFWHFRDSQTVFTNIAADTGASYIMTGTGDPVQTFGASVTANYMQTLGVQPLLGRLFRPEEEMKADVALVTDAFWHARLGSDPNVIGRSLTLNGGRHHGDRRDQKAAGRMVGGRTRPSSR